MTLSPAARDFSAYSDTSKFLLFFIQALLKTGYYTPGHPETAKAREGLYRGLCSVLKGHRELTFMVAAVDTRDVFVDGIVEDPVSIRSFMLKGMSEMFVPKFLAYFDRKNLSSFSMKSTISRNEFETFIDIMSESPLHEEKTDSREELTMELIRQNVLHVSTVFNVDLVGQDRKLPWRVNIALTRLRRDLSLIPLYKSLSREEMNRLKNMVFDDIIRPIRSHEIVKDLLLNLDIISPDIQGFSREEFENKVTDCVRKEYLVRAAADILDVFVFQRESYERLQDKGMLRRLTFIEEIARKVALKIIGHGVPDEGLLLSFFDKGILAISDLPAEIQRTVRRKEEVERFLRDPRRFFLSLDRADNDEDIRRTASRLLDFLPELFTRNRFSEADNILKNIKKKGLKISSLDPAILDRIALSTEKKLEDSTKEEQKVILEMTDMMDELSIVICMNLLTNKSRMSRKIACEKLVNHGTAAIPALKKSLQKRKDWYFIRNVIMILAEIGQGSPGLEVIFKKHLHHEEARVRFESVIGLVNVMGPSAEALLTGVLRDSDPLVRKKVIWALGKIKSVTPEVISYFVGTITGRIREEEAVLEQILSSLQAYPRDLDETKQVEQAILKVLSKGQGVLARFTARYFLSDRLKERLCDTLGAIGGSKSRKTLKKMIQNEDPLLGERAQQALDRLEQEDDGQGR